MTNANGVKDGATAIILMVCPDQRGIVHKLANFVAANNGNIVDNDFHNDRAAGLFLGRLEFSLEGFAISDRSQLKSAAKAVCAPLGGQVSVFFSDEPQKVAIFCSKQDHCLLDLLWRWRQKELGPCEIALIVSNHEDLRPHAELYGVPYHVFKVTKDNKAALEAAELELLKNEGIDLVIMAKYMQILSDDFLRTFPNVISWVSFFRAFLSLI